MLCDPTIEPLEYHEIDFSMWTDESCGMQLDLRSVDEVCPNGLLAALTTV